LELPLQSLFEAQREFVKLGGKSKAAQAICTETGSNSENSSCTLAR